MASNTFIPITSLPILPGTPTVSMWLPIQAAGVTWRVDARSFPLVTDTLLTWNDQVASLPGSRMIEAGPGVSISYGTPGRAIISASTSGSIIVLNQSVSAALAGTEQDWNPTGWDGAVGKSRLIVDPSTSPGILGGLDASAAVDGQLIALMNDSAANSLRLINNDAGSLADNRFYCPGGANFTLVAMQCIFLMKRSTGWRLFT